MLIQICPAGHGMLVLRHSLISTRAQVSVTVSSLERFKVRCSHYVTLQRKVLPVGEYNCSWHLASLIQCLQSEDWGGIKAIDPTEKQWKFGIELVFVSKPLKVSPKHTKS